MKTKLKIKGEITLKKYDQTSLSFIQTLWNRIVVKLNLNRKRFYLLGNLLATETKQNIICNAGLNVLARLLANDNTYTGYITKMALGSGTGSFDGTETTLYTEVYRNATASYTSSGAIAYLTGYYTETEVDGTFTEFGNFIDGAAGADTGQLFSHLSVNWVKSNTEAWVVDCKYTLASA